MPEPTFGTMTADDDLPRTIRREREARERLRWLNPLYKVMKDTLKLESQLEVIDYSKRNFVHADMTARAFAAKQEEKGEGFLQLWVRMMKVQATSPDLGKHDPGLLKLLEILRSPDSATELKRLMGRMFDSVDKVMAGLEGPDGSVILTERNKVAVAKMNKEGLSRKQFLPQLAKQRAETHRWLLERGMPCPTLVVWGYNDPAAQLENGMQLVELFMEKQRDTEVRIFNKSGHFVMREHPAAFNRLIDTYVSAHR